MTFDIITIFPGFFSSVLEHGLLKRGLAGGQIKIRVHDLRDYTDDPHRTVDDRPFGGGPGMVLKAEPLFRAVEALRTESSVGPVGTPRVVLLSPQGRILTQRVAEELALESRIVLICGRYEGVDERVATALATDEISVGDYVLAGGELAAAVVMESVVRLLPGVLGNEASSKQDSFSGPDRQKNGAGLLDCPHYTRPVEFRGLRVPDVLLSGDHGEIRRWRRREAIRRTRLRRPDLLEHAMLDKQSLGLLEDLRRDDPKSSGQGS